MGKQQWKMVAGELDEKRRKRTPLPNKKAANKHTGLRSRNKRQKQAQSRSSTGKIHPSSTQILTTIAFHNRRQHSKMAPLAPLAVPPLSFRSLLRNIVPNSKTKNSKKNKKTKMATGFLPRGFGPIATFGVTSPPWR
jgi:hypothetical protein